MTQVSMQHNNDCLRACVASILDLSLERLPRPPERLNDDNWPVYQESLRELVRETYGYEMLILSADASYAPRGLMIASFPSPSHDDTLHAVVFKDGKVLWDPASLYREKGIVYEGTPVDWIIFQALDPSTFIYRRRWPSIMAEEIAGADPRSARARAEFDHVGRSNY